VSTVRQVPFENAVFVGDSPQDMHGENADEQLANPQKRICLIEFLHLGLIIVCQGSGGAATMSSRATKSRCVRNAPQSRRIYATDKGNPSGATRENLKKSTEGDFFDFRYYHSVFKKKVFIDFSYCISRKHPG